MGYKKHRCVPFVLNEAAHSFICSSITLVLYYSARLHSFIVMHSSLFTPAIGLAILSFASARVLEKRVCVEDPAYRGLWNNPSIYDDVNPFCAGLLGLEAPSYCAGTRTSTMYVSPALTCDVILTLPGLRAMLSQRQAPLPQPRQCLPPDTKLSPIRSSHSTSAMLSTP